MRYLFLSNLAVIMSVLAIMGKSAWGKSLWMK
jgi:hypothetical protein